VIVGLLVACARTPHVPVDLQVDVDSALPDGAEAVMICVTDGPSRHFGAADGAFALTGLFADEWPEITADVLDSDDIVVASTGPFVADSAYTVAALVDCPGCSGCSSTGVTPAAGEPSWVLGLRFTP
jgi:hypothetical protein